VTSEYPSVSEPSNEPRPEAYIREPEPEAEPAPDTFTVPRYLFNYVLIAAVSLIAGILIGGLVFGGNNTPAVTGEQIAAIVRQAVAEAGDGSGGAAADSGQQRRDLMANLITDDPSLGPDDAPVIIVEFSDFYCPWCGRYATETFPRLVEDYEGYIRIIYRDMPIVGGQPSVQAAIAGECAHQQGNFWDFHNLVFNNSTLRERTDYLTFAEEMGLDTATFEACLDNPQTATEVTLDRFDGEDLGIRGVPAFFINGRFVSGAQPYDNFALIIDAELIRAGITPPSQQ
jgi:protein-disulfide isomerase